MTSIVAVSDDLLSWLVDLVGLLYLAAVVAVTDHLLGGTLVGVAVGLVVVVGDSDLAFGRLLETIAGFLLTYLGGIVLVLLVVAWPRRKRIRRKRVKGKEDSKVVVFFSMVTC